MIFILQVWVPKLEGKYWKLNQCLFEFHGGIPRVLVVRNEEAPLVTFIGGFEALVIL